MIRVKNNMAALIRTEQICSFMEVRNVRMERIQQSDIGPHGSPGRRTRLQLMISLIID